jgi:hypothetical protein
VYRAVCISGMLIGFINSFQSSGKSVIQYTLFTKLRFCPAVVAKVGLVMNNAANTLRAALQFLWVDEMLLAVCSVKRQFLKRKVGPH